jgi:hypothetical protein
MMDFRQIKPMPVKYLNGVKAIMPQKAPDIF